MAGAFTWFSCTTFATKCQPNLSIREQPLLPSLDVFGMGWVMKRPSQSAAAEMLPRPNILQLNTKGLTGRTISVIEQLVYKNKAFIIVLQATHCTTANKLVIPNFSLAGSVLSRNHGLATFVYERLEWSLVDQSPEQSETEWLCVDVTGYKIINVYKLPRSRFTPTAIPTFPHPSQYVGDFSCQHVNWGYNKTSPDIEILDSWSTSNNLGLLYDPKEIASFFSHRWNVGTIPDLAFASLGQASRLTYRCVLGKFPWSQHRPSLITPCPVSAISIASQLVKNGAHRTGGRESTRPVNSQLSDLWKIPTPKGHSISERFIPEELAAALRRLKPGKSPGLYSIFRSLYSTPGREFPKCRLAQSYLCFTRYDLATTGRL